MKVLVACEESQITTFAFRAKGHTAFSCDLQPCSGGFPEWHIQDDCFNVINDEWDLIIAHPPCTYLSIAGACNLYKNGVIDVARYEKMISAATFFKRFLDLNTRVCVENPRVMDICGLPPYSQTIQPYQFGDNYTKLTCLWLKDLPPLIPSCVAPIGSQRNPLGTVSWVGTHHGSIQRSKSFWGIAQAMANQWNF